MTGWTYSYGAKPCTVFAYERLPRPRLDRGRRIRDRPPPLHDQHRAGTGSRLLAAVCAAGIPFEVAWTWPHVSRAFERKVHCLKNTPSLCPTCTKTELHARDYNPRPSTAATTIGSVP